MQSTILRLEDASELLAILILYSLGHFPWWQFALFLLIPDVSAVGYLKNARLGGLLYNLGHSSILPWHF